MIVVIVDVVIVVDGRPVGIIIHRWKRSNHDMRRRSYNDRRLYDNCGWQRLYICSLRGDIGCTACEKK
jgi:hypothetical protein